MTMISTVTAVRLTTSGNGNLIPATDNHRDLRQYTLPGGEILGEKYSILLYHPPRNRFSSHGIRSVCGRCAVRWERVFIPLPHSTSMNFFQIIRVNTWSLELKFIV